MTKESYIDLQLKASLWNTNRDESWHLNNRQTKNKTGVLTLAVVLLLTGVIGLAVL